MFHIPSNPVQHVIETVRRLWRARSVVDPTIDDRLDVLGAQSTSLTSEISSLEQFIVASPKAVKESKLRGINTLPAPDEMIAAPALRLSRQQIQAIRQRRHKDLLGFVFLLLCLGSVVLWLGYQLTFYSIL